MVVYDKCGRETTVITICGVYKLGIRCTRSVKTHSRLSFGEVIKRVFILVSPVFKSDTLYRHRWAVQSHVKRSHITVGRRGLTSRVRCHFSVFPFYRGLLFLQPTRRCGFWHFFKGIPKRRIVISGDRGDVQIYPGLWIFALNIFNCFYISK